MCHSVHRAGRWSASKRVCIGGGGALHPGGLPPGVSASGGRVLHLRGLGRFPPLDTTVCSKQAGDMHPTEIHSCYYRPQRSWGKLMFLQVCVILFTGEEYLTRYTPQTRYTPLRPGTSPGTGTPSQTRYNPPGPGTPPGTGTPPWDQVHPRPGRYGLRAGGTHPTGMHSCI